MRFLVPAQLSKHSHNHNHLAAAAKIAADIKRGLREMRDEVKVLLKVPLLLKGSSWRIL